MASDRVNGDSDVGSMRSRLIGSIGVAALVAGSLVVSPIPAHAADPVNLTFLNINDFHGRIDANTVKFAGTIEQRRTAAEAAGGAAVFLSAGDNIGASLFASSVAADQPTIDVLNALDLKASAVGNHEFDRGFSDLTDRVIAGGNNARWEYLGANVYLKGTTTPALPEYSMIEMAGLRVAVIGAVTEETPTLVTPGGITGLDFGNPVEAVNRVAARLSDGDPGNGEADVMIAEYHDGAGAGIPEGSTLEEEVAVGGSFAQIVQETSARVAAIFTGHTHKQYAWEGPVPGRPGLTRPIVQTGSYGENIGEMVLTVDPATGEVTSHTAVNVQRTMTSDSDLTTTYPRVAEVQSIVQAAIAAADVVGSQAVGSVTSDITTAFSGGSYVNGVYTGSGPNPTTGRDDRSKESTLGNLVANSLRDSLDDPARGGAQIGVVNPGGLRADLLYAGDSDPNTPDGPGVVTYAEANAVLPFVNNLWTTTLTGAQFTSMLEQQWQTNPKLPPARPYLQLGLSDNVTYTFDPAAPQDQHITSVVIDGVPLDPAANYRIGTFSFLTTGGDNFRVLAEGANARDSGLIDRDAWIEYLQNNPGLSPDFARHAVSVTDLPTEVVAGETVAFVVADLDLTSLGSPENTTLTVELNGEDIGTAAVSGGSAAVSVTIPAGTPAGPNMLTLVAAASNTVVTIPVSATVPVSTTVELSASRPSQIYGSPNRVTLTATVTSSTGDSVAGNVDFVSGSTVLGTAPIINGQATFTLPSSTPAGALSVVARFAGSDQVPAAESAPVPVTVDKATSAAVLLSTKTNYRQNPFLPSLLVGVVVLNNGQPARGTVAITQDGAVVKTVQVSNGFFLWVVPRNLPKDTYEYVATYRPADENNVSGVDSNPVFIQVR